MNGETLKAASSVGQLHFSYQLLTRTLTSNNAIKVFRDRVDDRGDDTSVRYCDGASIEERRASSVTGVTASLSARSEVPGTFNEGYGAVQLYWQRT
eukprot:CAMPEP_0194755530 /NCGR_PEP_ID=MMETSP0323_2-20130528/9390_1 /TAXON_ID=2866 ORGANISM="Crypthecodinium cohnii, Strain Seligo" /NCGR_SAMPLE_ID=MMETSP0323_2 /ASSEMBLY_ACC=CAM_ASM_000346 /LENGTH=95 /DNA_ID=CAMNT_0039674625 /DNA_START=51 /DNA_END=335 /DNA_ORIENTATION=+